MIVIKEKRVSGLPLLEIVAEEKKQETLPTVLFYHGWTNYMESVIVNGYELAKRGFRALLPEAYLHGSRSGNRPVSENGLEFWNVVAHSINESQIIRNHYVEEELSDPERFGVSGLSMGGITTAAMLTQYDWIKAAVVLMGSPAPLSFSKWLLSSPWADQVKEEESERIPALTKEELDQALDALKPISLNLHPETINGRPVLFWHGTEDQLVPFQPTYDFYQRVKKEEYGQLVEFSIGRGVEHKVPYLTSVEMAEFFKKNI